MFGSKFGSCFWKYQRWRMKPFNDRETNFLHCIYHLLLNTTPVSSLHRVACSATFPPSRNPQLTSSIQQWYNSVTRNPKTIIGVVLAAQQRHSSRENCCFLLGHLLYVYLTEGCLVNRCCGCIVIPPQQKIVTIKMRWFGH